MNARIIIGSVEMRANHSRRFPFVPEMVRIEKALVSNYKRELEGMGYTVEIVVYDNLDTNVYGCSVDDTNKLWDAPVDWEYINPEVAAIINEYTGEEN